MTIYNYWYLPWTATVAVVLESVVIIINYKKKIQVVPHITETPLAAPQKNNSQKYNAAAAEHNNKYITSILHNTKQPLVQLTSLNWRKILMIGKYI